MKPINPKKFSVNSLIWLKNLQWRRKESFRVTLGPLKDYQAPTAGGPVGEGPPDGSEVSFVKRFKVFENELISQKCQHFSSSKYPFSKKNLGKLNIFYKNF